MRKTMTFLLVLFALVSCAKEKEDTLKTDSRKNIEEVNARRNLQQDLIGTAYGNVLKMSSAFEKGDTSEVSTLGRETRLLLQGYADSVEGNKLPDLEQRAKAMVSDFDSMLSYWDKGDIKQAMALTSQCKYKLNSLRELTGLKRMK